MSNTNQIKSIWLTTFKGRYFWKSYAIIMAISLLIVGSDAYFNFINSGENPKWKNQWDGPIWAMIIVFFVGFSQLKHIKTKFNHLIWYNLKDFGRFFSYFVLQILIYTLIYFVSVWLLQQIAGIVLFQSAINYDVKMLGAFFSLFYTSLLISAIVWLFPSVWTIIGSFFVFVLKDLLEMGLQKIKITSSILPTEYVTKLASSFYWQWYEILFLCFYLILAQFVIYYRFKRIWKQS